MDFWLFFFYKISDPNLYEARQLLKLFDCDLDHNQTILATIWPHTNWDQKSCKRKKARSPFGKRFTKYLSKPCSMEDYKTFLIKIVDRYDGDGSNDMPGLTKPIIYWDVMLSLIHI